MKKLILAAIFLFTMTIFGCGGIRSVKRVKKNPGREACKASCVEAKDKCLEEAKSMVEQNACGVSKKRCIEKCD